MGFTRPLETFGQTHIPPLSDGELTASYSASDWGQLNKSWKITTYWTLPESGEPVEKPSVTRSMKAEYLALRKRTWDEVKGQVLRDYSGAWERLADL